MGNALRLLPSNPTPVGFRCIQITFPDDDEWERALYSEIARLGNWNMWQRDIGHNGTVVAKQWQTALTTWERCMTFDVRQNSLAPCTLEKTTDGVSWTAWANLQLCPPRLRLNGQKIEVSLDGGSTWIELPGQGDERQDGTYDPPWPPGSIPPGQTGQCLAAENILSIYSTALTQMRAEIALLKPPTAVAAVGTGILSLFMPAAIIGTIMLVLCGVLEEIGTAGIDDLLSTDTLNKLRCNLDAHAQSDGSFTAAGYNDFYSQLAIDFAGLKLSALEYYFDMLGPVGLSRQGAADGISSATCACGGWCYKWDFTITDGSAQGWAIPTFDGGAPGAIYAAGTGYIYNDFYAGGTPLRDCVIENGTNVVNWTNIRVKLYYQFGAFNGPTPPAIVIRRDGATLYSIDMPWTDGNHIVNYASGGLTLDTLRVALQASVNEPFSGNIIISEITIWGTGACPYGTPNC